MIRSRNSVLWCATALFSLVFATAANAHGGPGRGPFGGRRDFSPFSGGPFGIGLGHRAEGMNQCRHDCAVAGRDCHDAARATARLCVQSTCSSELQAAQDACSRDRSSDACSSARSALRQCRQPCITAYMSSSEACRTNTRTCASPCPDVVAKDPQCVAQCVQPSQSCVSTAAGQAQTCRDTCSDPVAAASQACSAVIDLSAVSACVTAWQAALACLQPCDHTLRSALQSCAQEASTCTNACPAATPAPTPTATPTS